MSYVFDDGKPDANSDAGGGYKFVDEAGGFKASAKQIIGSTIKGAGQAAGDYLPFVGPDNALKRYGQEVVDANPTSVGSLADIADRPWTATKEGVGNAATSVAGVLGARAAGMGITAAAPLAGPLAPVVAALGQGVAWGGPALMAALPSYGGIREDQIKGDATNQDSFKAKATALLGAGAVGAIEVAFGPQNWALLLTTKKGQAELAKKFAFKSAPANIAKGVVGGALVEGGEELVQNPIEQMAAFQDPRTPENVEKTVFGGAMGAIGGGVVGGGFGAAAHVAKPQFTPHEELLNKTAETVIATRNAETKLTTEAANDRQKPGTAAGQKTAKAAEETDAAGQTILGDISDRQNIQGIPGQVGEGQEPVQTQPEQAGGRETVETGGILQTPGADRRVVPPIIPDETPAPVQSRTVFTEREQPESRQNVGINVAIAPESRPGLNGIVEPMRAEIVTGNGLPIVLNREFQGKYKITGADGSPIGAISYRPTADGTAFVVSGVDVRPEFRRKGVATAVYDYLEKSVIGAPFEQSGGQSEAGAAFRAARSEKISGKSPAVSENGPETRQNAPAATLSAKYAENGDILRVRPGIPGAGTAVTLLDRRGEGSLAFVRRGDDVEVSADLGNYELVASPRRYSEIQAKYPDDFRQPAPGEALPAQSTGNVVNLEDFKALIRSARLYDKDTREEIRVTLKDIETAQNSGRMTDVVAEHVRSASRIAQNKGDPDDVLDALEKAHAILYPSAANEALPAPATTIPAQPVAPQEAVKAQPPAISAPAIPETKTPPDLLQKSGAIPDSAQKSGQSRSGTTTAATRQRPMKDIESPSARAESGQESGQARRYSDGTKSPAPRQIGDNDQQPGVSGAQVSQSQQQTRISRTRRPVLSEGRGTAQELSQTSPELRSGGAAFEHTRGTDTLAPGAASYPSQRNQSDKHSDKLSTSSRSQERADAPSPALAPPSLTGVVESSDVLSRTSAQVGAVSSPPDTGKLYSTELPHQSYDSILSVERIIPQKTAPETGVRPAGKILGADVRKISDVNLGRFAKSKTARISDLAKTELAWRAAQVKPAELSKYGKGADARKPAEAVMEPWQMTRDELAALETKSRQAAAKSPQRSAASLNNLARADRAVQDLRSHKALIEQRVKDGKPVPANVLAEYPDLAKPAAPVAEAAKPESTEQTPEQIYDASLEAFKTASRKFTAVRNDYRAKKVDDATFLAAKAAFDGAQAVADAAETRFIDSKNAPAEPTPEPPVSAPAEKPLSAADHLEAAAKLMREQAAQPNPEATPEPAPRQEGGDVESYSRGEPGPGLPAADIRAHIAGIVDRLAVPVTVYDDVAAALADGVTLPDDTRGFASKGRLSLVAENIKTLLDAEKVLFHELFHVGIRAVAKQAKDANAAFANYTAALNRVAMANPEVRRRAKAWRDKYGEDKTEQFRAAGIEDNLEARVRLTSFDEAIADMAGERRGKPVTRLNELIAALQRLVRALGFDELANYMESHTDAEVLSLIRQATQSVSRGTTTFAGAMAGEPSYVRADQTSTPGLWSMSQEEWTAHKKTLNGPAEIGKAVREREKQTEQAAASMMKREWEPLGNIIDRMGIESGRVGGAVNRLEKSGIVERKEVEGAKFVEYRYRLKQTPESFSRLDQTGTGDPDIMESRAGSPEAPITAPDWVQAQPADMQETLRKAGAWRPKQTLQDRIAGWTENWQAKLRQGMVDQFDPIKSLDYHAYMLARMSKSAAGPLEAALFDGTVFLDKDGAVDVNYEKGGFVARMQALKGEHDRFFSWVIGNRAARLMEEGKEHNFTKDDIARLKTLNQGNMEDGSHRNAVYLKALADLNRYNKSILDMAEKAGLVDGESRPFWEKEFYVPFYRMTEGDVTKGPVKQGGLVRQYAFKTLKGGAEAIGDPMENILKNWAHLIDASLKNQAAVASLDAAVKVGVARETTADEKGAVFVMKNGQKTYYAVDDPFVLDAINSLGFSGFTGPAMKVMSSFKRWLTFGVTISPAFRIRNVIRDSISMIGVNPASYNVLDNVLTGWKLTAEDSPAYASMIAGGGVIRFGTLETESAANIKRLVDSGVDANTVLDSPAKVKAMLKTTYDWWMRMGDRSENMNRAALYQKLRDEGRSHLEASYAARDTMDFSMQGTWSAIRFLAQTVPFFNARLQGMYKLGRGAAEDPRRFSYVVGGAALASIALLLAYQDDDDWKQREDFDRETYWWFKIGDTAFRIPKPFEIGALATLAERGLEAMITDDLTGKQFVKRIGSLVGQQLSMNPVPQLFMPMIETWANRDAFTGRPIESMGMERLSPAERISPYTSAFAQLVGKNGVVSPVQIDHLINGYFGWLGTHAVATADLALRPVMGLPEKPAMRIDDVFTIGDFARSMPAYQSKYVTHLYEQGKEVQEAMADLRAAQKIGATEKAAEIMKDRGDKIKLYRLYTHAEKQLTQINSQIKRVQMREGDADVKRARLNQLYLQRNRIAKITGERAQATQR